VEQKYGDRADNALLEDFVSDVLDWYNKEHQVRPMSTPQFTLQDYQRKKLLRFQADYDIFPEIVLPSYQKLSVKQDVVKVENSDIQAELDKIRQNHGELQLREGPAQKGDELTLMVFVYDDENDGQALEENKIMKTVLGENSQIPDLDKNLEGLAGGEKREFNITYPEDFQAKELQGRTLRFNVECKEVNQKIYPELDDELAKDEGYESLEQLKDKIRESLESSGEHYFKEEAKGRLLEKLVEQVKVELPTSMRQKEIASAVEKEAQERQIQAQNTQELEEAIGGKEGKKVVDDVVSRAEDNAKRVLILVQIARQENIEVTDEDIDGRVAEIAAQYGMQGQDLRQRLEENGTLNSIANDIMVQKAVDFLYEQAEKKKGKTVKFSDIGKK
jgi:trigger factor